MARGRGDAPLAGARRDGLEVRGRARPVLELAPRDAAAVERLQIAPVEREGVLAGRRGLGRVAAPQRREGQVQRDGEPQLRGLLRIAGAGDGGEGLAEGGDGRLPLLPLEVFLGLALPRLGDDERGLRGDEGRIRGLRHRRLRGSTSVQCEFIVNLGTARRCVCSWRSSRGARAPSHQTGSAASHRRTRAPPTRDIGRARRRRTTKRATGSGGSRRRTTLSSTKRATATRSASASC